MIANRVGLKPPTVSCILRRWKLNNHDIDYLSKVKKGRKRKFNSFQEVSMTSPKTLRDLAHLTLVQRAEHYKALYKLPTLSTGTICKVYKRHEVKFMCPNYGYNRKLNNHRDLCSKQ